MSFNLLLDSSAVRQDTQFIDMSIEALLVLFFISAIVFMLDRILDYLADREGKRLISKLPLSDDICRLAGIDRGDLTYKILRVSGRRKSKCYNVRFYYHPSKPGDPSVRALVAVPVGTTVQVAPFKESQKTWPKDAQTLIAHQIKTLQRADQASVSD